MVSVAVTICVLLTFVTLGTADVLNLNGDWKLNDSSGEYHDLPVQVPGGIYTDLMANKVIDFDIFYGYGDKITTWVPRRNWTYFRSFEVTQEVMNKNFVNIVFEGLDTITNIYINNIKVGSSQNMFVRYIFNIKNVLKVGNNNIEINFQSPIEAANNLAEEHNTNYVISPDCPEGSYQKECHVNMLRKMQSSFSWDWGPSFPSVGIWKDVYIESYDVSVLRYITTDTVADSDKTVYTININAYLASNYDSPDQSIVGTLTVTLCLSDRNITNVVDVNQKANEYSEVIVASSLEISTDLIEEWWPNGYGSQTLYNLTVTFTGKTENSIKTQQTKRIGFRTIELVQEKIGNGLSFYFKINDVPIFMKGSNQIPISVLPERDTEKIVVQRILRTARDSNMNMLRVWGGGIYESDYFYDLADEYGILIWQDFMFACALYPATDAYLNNILEEVRHQVKRLTSHPSIALFSGNNENELFMAIYSYLLPNYELYKQDYIKLYIDTIEKEFKRLTSNRRILVTSSPSNGPKSVDEGYIAKNPVSSDFGDVHFYDYFRNSFDSNTFPKPRFTSEYGYQSLPALETLLSANSNMSDLNINSPWSEFRQHNLLGNYPLKLLMNYQLELPSENDEDNFIKAFIYYSQIIQAMSVKVETENYRILRSNVIDGVDANTMGALYWQMNDVWAAPTWAGLDFNGRWKMLQYYAKKFFSSIIITGQVDSNRTTNIYIVNDNLNSKIVTAEIEVYKWDSLIAVYNISTEVKLVPNSSMFVKSFDTDQFLADLNCGALDNAKSNCFFHLRLTVDGTDVAPTNFVLPNALRDSNIQNANVIIESVKACDDGTTYAINVKTDQIAMFVWLDAHDIIGVFSDNGFHMVETNKTIYFNSEESTSLEDITKALTVIHVNSDKY